MLRASSLALVAALLVAPAAARACGCGCGLFDVQSGGPDDVYPLQTGQPSAAHAGGLAYLEYDQADQNQNWHGHRPASNDDNPDKLLRTHFVTAGAQLMSDSGWGLMAELPVWNRLFKTQDDGGNPVAFQDTSVGDVRLRGVYSGLSSDMSTGLTLGAKLPTGHFRTPGFDRDSEIGSGSTDALLGLYHLGLITADARWTWFGNLLFDQPVLTAGGYRPGAELDAILGGSFGGWQVGGARLSPLAQAIVSVRGRDTGTQAHFGDTGYTRLLAGPGVRLALGRFLATATVGLPVAQSVNGDQLMAPAYWRASTGFRF